MRNSALLLFLCISVVGSAQTSTYSRKGISLRGKIFGMPVVEDGFFRTATIGAEFKLLNKHSIGLDYVHFRWRIEEDTLANGVESGSGPSVYSRRNYINIDYRYYPFSDIDLYANAFLKIGQREVWSPDSTILYENWNDRLFAHSSNFMDYGLAIGWRFDFGTEDRIGLDGNIGLVRRFSHVWYEHGQYFDQNTISNVQYEKYGDSESNWVIHMRLNFFVKILKF